MTQAGSIYGRLLLDTSGYTSPLRQAVAQGQAAGASLRQSLEKPLVPRMDTSRLTAGMNEFMATAGKSQAAAQAMMMLGGPIGQIAGQIWSLVSVVGTLWEAYGAATTAAGVSATAFTAQATAAGVAATTTAAKATASGVAAAASTAEAAAASRVTVTTLSTAAAHQASVLSVDNLTRANLRLALSHLAVQRSAAAARSSSMIDGVLISGRSVAVLPQQMAQISQASTALAGTARGASTALATIGPAAGSATTSLGGLAAAGSALGPVLAGVGVAAAALAVPLIGLGVIKGALNSEFVQLAGKAETTAVAFEVLTGSAATAQSLLSELKAFAASTPLNFPEIASSARQLLAMGGNAATVTQELRRLGDVGGLLGQPLQEMAYLYGQIRSQQTAYTQDLNQFAGRGVPIYAELGKILGTNAAGVKQLASEGQITFPLIEQAFKNMTAAGGQFSGGLARQSTTLDGLKSTMADAWDTMKTKIGQALIPALDLKKWVETFTKWTEAATPKVVAMFTAGAAAAGPFIDVFRSVSGHLRSILSLGSEWGKTFDAVFGDGALAAVGKFVLAWNPLTIVLKASAAMLDQISVAIRGLASALETIRKGVDAVQAWESRNTGARGALNVLTMGMYSNLAKVGSATAQPAAQAAAAQPPGSAPAAPSGGPTGEKFDVAKSADRTRELEIATRIAHLRAQQKADEAELLDLRTKFEAASAKAAANVQAALKAKDMPAYTQAYAEQSALTGKYMADEAALIAKARASAENAAAEERNRLFTAATEAQTAALRAAGKELEADLMTSRLAGRRELADVANPKERAFIEDKLASERQQILDRHAKATADKAREDADKARRLAREQADADAELQASLLEEQGRTADAELVRFDAQWQRRIDAAETAEQKMTLAATYESERRRKVAEDETRLHESLRDRLAGTAAEFGKLSGEQRSAAYAALNRAAGAALAVPASPAGEPSMLARAASLATPPRQAAADSPQQRAMVEQQAKVVGLNERLGKVVEAMNERFAAVAMNLRGIEQAVSRPQLSVANL